MIRVAVLMLAIALTPNIVAAQGKPKVGDSTAYNQAYELLFDSTARAKKAVAILLPQGKSVEALNDRELSLLCRAYNELGERKKQLATATRLWDLKPGSAESTRWMINSLLNVYAYAKDSKPLIDFVDNAIDKGLGNRRDLLILKATAILARKDESTEAERRVTVSDLLVDAYSSGPGLPLIDDDDSFVVLDSPDFVDFEVPFASFFSAAERDALKLRMQKARELADKEKERTK